MEYATFLLHSSLPLVANRLPEPYILHWKLLVEGIAILSKPTLHYSEIIVAQEKLRTFVDQVPILYQPNYVTIKLHYLRHLAQSCIDFGSLRNFSAVPFEDLNGTLAAMNTANFSIEESLFDKFNFTSNINATIKSMRDVDNQPIKRDSPYGKLLAQNGFNWNEIDDNLKKGWSFVKLEDSRIVYIKHSELRSVDLSEEIQILLQDNSININKVQRFNRIRIGKHHLRSSSTNSKHWNSSSCVYKAVGGYSFGVIQTFLKYNDKYLAVVKKVATEERLSIITPVIRSSLQTCIQVIPISSILESAISVYNSSNHTDYYSSLTSRPLFCLREVSTIPLYSQHEDTMDITEEEALDLIKLYTT